MLVTYGTNIYGEKNVIIAFETMQASFTLLEGKDSNKWHPYPSAEFTDDKEEDFKKFIFNLIKDNLKIKIAEETKCPYIVYDKGLIK